ncbi:Zinc/iron permease [Mycena pura]|uniref:Zinc/iron permease n=1 Tax=Mycena pura TaxID=153505 RepID=A0AAD6UV36_9AGAR|nr:Zinc/iron permease [Mycena pura]
MFALLIMSTLLGASSFLVGVLPLSFALSKQHIARFSIFGSGTPAFPIYIRDCTRSPGILIGTALGIIIPEGIETLAAAHASTELPTSQIALSLIVGFALMMVVEQLISPHAHGHPHAPDLPLHQRATSTVEFDAGMGDLEEPDRGTGFMQVDMLSDEARSSRARAYPLTFGLVIHALADGLALGVSSVSAPIASADSASETHLSVIVFLALMIHKAPTSLALTTALLRTSLPPPECRKHLAVFSAATPVGAILSYTSLTLFSAGAAQANWTGLALLVSGGTFLYVATVLQPASHAPAEDSGPEMSPVMRVLLTATGMVTPYVIGHVVLPEVH